MDARSTTEVSTVSSKCALMQRNGVELVQCLNVSPSVQICLLYGRVVTDLVDFDGRNCVGFVFSYWIK